MRVPARASATPGRGQLRPPARGPAWFLPRRSRRWGSCAARSARANPSFCFPPSHPPGRAQPEGRLARGAARAPRQAQLFEEGVVVPETAERNFQLMWPWMVPLEGAVPLTVPADRSSNQSSVPDCLRKPSFSEEASATFLLSEAVKAQVAIAAFPPFPAAFTGFKK